MGNFISVWDWLLLPFYFVIIYVIANSIKKKHIANNPEYKYFISGLFAKIIGGIGVVLIYIYYYEGGDTLYYYIGTKAMCDLSFKNFSVYFDLMMNNRTMENYFVFDYDTWAPYLYMYRDTKAFAVIRFSTIFGFIGLNNFILTVIGLASFSYIGVWKLYKLFLYNFPDQMKNFAVSIIFIPSVLFWGSGLLKDTFTLSATGWLLYSFFMLFFLKKKKGQNITSIIFNSFIILSIKPYIFFAIVSGLIVVFTIKYIKNIKSTFLKIVVLPILLLTIWVGGSLFMMQIGQTVGGAYTSTEKLIDTAILTQEDLSRDYYGENSFDIGEIEPSVIGLMSKAPIALTAGLFRPYIWETTNIVMLFSGIENLIILLFCLYTLFITFYSWTKHGFKFMYMAIFDNELIIFSIIFAIIFAFMIGITTANFGALVRYKIPLIPFFISSLYIMISRYNKYDFTKGEFKIKEN